MLKQGSLIALALLLGGCASSNDHTRLTLSPKPIISTEPNKPHRVLRMEQRDLRPIQHIAVIHDDDQIQTLEVQESLPILLSDVLESQFTAQGYAFSSGSRNILRLDVIEALVKVTEGNISHNLNGRLQLQLVVLSPNGQFTKRYTAKSEKTGAMSVSPSDIQHSMNKLTQLLLTDIHADPELHDYLKRKL